MERTHALFHPKINIHEMETWYMSKKSMVLGIAVLCLCFLNGCSNKEVAEVPINFKGNCKENNENAYPEHIDMVLSSGVEVDADIDIPEIDMKDVSTYQGDVLKIDIRELSDVLLGVSIPKYTEGEGQGDTAEGLSTYLGEDGSEIISIDDTWVKFSSVKFAHIRTDFETEMNSKRQTDFSFASRYKADLEIKEILQRLDIEIYSEYECTSMDYKLLKEKNLEQYEGMEDVEEFKEEMNMLNTIPWSEDYNCYCFTYYGAIDGYKLHSQDRETSNNVVPGSIIRAVYSKDGIQSLEISNIYIKQKEVDKKTLCTIDTVLKAVDKKYNSIIMQGDYKVVSLELEYIADIQDNKMKYTLLPVWRCCISHKYDTQDKNSSDIVNIEDYSIIFIDAISGTEIYSGETI